MKVEAIGYNDPRLFYNTPHFKDKHTNSIHLCATKSLERGVRQLTLKRNTGLNINNISNSLDFIKAILGDWSSPGRKLEQYAKLSEIIRDCKNKLGNNENEILKAFRLNQSETLQTMRVLTEINLLPANFKQLSLEREEEVFNILWEEMLLRDASFKEIQETINTTWEDPALFRKKVKNAFKKCSVEESDNNKIVLHGFYFITPIQHRIFSLLKKSGFELIFLNLYNPAFPSIFKSVRYFISQNNGWTDDWQFNPANNEGFYIGKRFASSFEDASYESDGVSNIKKISYEDFYEFLNDYEDHDLAKKTIYLSPAQNDLNNRIKEYHPDIYIEDRHLLSYPAPQFLFHIHKMWNEKENTLILSADTLMECFSSGWLIDPVTKKNASFYTKRLIELLPFFQSCTKAEDWISHAAKLLEIYKSIIRPLESHNEVGKPTDRIHQILENPYKWISYLNLNEEEVEQVIAFISELLRIASSLFENKERISLREHFARLEYIIENGLQSTVPAEQNIAKILIQKLQLIESEEKFLMQDLSEAIALYLSGSLDEDEDPENNEEKLEFANYKKIFSFEDIDGKVIEAMLNNKIIHICGLSEDNLPQSSVTLPWPLTKKTLESQKSNSSLKMYLLREELKPSISRYLFYSFISFAENGKVSWLKKWNDKEKIEESFYLLLLDLPIESPEASKNESTSLYFEDNLSRSATDINEFLQNFPEFLLKEYFYCPRRFFYSFIAQERPTFNSNFHLEFLFGNIVKTFPTILDKSNDEVKDILKKLFPQFGNLKFDYLISDNLKYPFVSRRAEKFDGKEYLLSQKQMQLLLHVGSKSIIKSTEEVDLLSRWDSIFNFEYKGLRQRIAQDISIDKDPLLTPQPSSLCRFCPHKDHCPSSYFPIDDEQRKLSSSKS